MKLVYKNTLLLSLMAVLCMSQTAFAETTSLASSTAVSIQTARSIASTSTDTLATSSLVVSTQALASTSAEVLTSVAATSTSTVVKGTPLLQNTANTQLTASSSLLETTVNPDTATTTNIVIPLTESTSTNASSSQVVSIPQSETLDLSIPLFKTGALDIVATNVDVPISTMSSSTVQSPVPTEIVPIQEIPAQPNYAFALTGKKITSQRTVENKDGEVVGHEAVATPLSSTVDNETGVVTVSGQCSAAYYVVLLFKNANDYVEDRRSYIVNRAYSCENGVFSYSISDLPPTLQNGNYYLLVGEEEKSGTWKAITELNEITINKNE